MADTISYDNLVASGDNLKTYNGLLLDGETVVRGQVLAKDVNGKIVAFNSAETTNGHDVFYGIAAEAKAASGADAKMRVYVRGDFIATGLTFENGADTIATILDAARDLNIYFENQ